jgi:hypothetical protein
MVDPVSETTSGTTPAATPAGGAAAQPGGKAAVDAARKQGLTYDNDVRYFYQKVRILAIGAEVLRSAGETAATTSTGANATEGPGQAGVIVFLVPADVAQKLLAAGSGGLYMTLPSETWKPVAIEPIPAEDFDKASKLPGEDPNRLTPYGPKGYVDQSTVSSTGSSGSGSSAPTTTR